MKDTKICCDNCGKQLNIDSSYPANYGLQLKSVNYGVNTSGVRYAILMEPSFKGERDFCGISCLKEWIEKTFTPTTNLYLEK
jgi:hypothetical protein